MHSSGISLWAVEASLLQQCCLNASLAPSNGTGIHVSSSKNIIRNNIVLGTQGNANYLVSKGTDNIEDHNIFGGSPDDYFVDFSNGNWRLSPTAFDAIDRGIAVGITGGWGWSRHTRRCPRHRCL
ncbi:MAG: hypothetical protein R3C68_09960 [Myxococcota bacterium]